MNTTPKDNTPDELDIFIWPDIFRAIGPGDDMVVSAEKLRDYIVREIDAAIGENSYINKASGAVTDEQFYQNGLRASQREVSADRGWRIG